MEHQDGETLVCMDCGATHEPEVGVLVCGKCGGLLEIAYPRSVFRSVSFNGRGVWRYRSILPRVERTVTLGEGDTPLVKVERLGESLGLRNLYVKFEGANPTGSFKDRGMTVAVSIALKFHARSVACASTGNTSASMSAYAARAGLRSIVFLPDGYVAPGKLLQAVAHGSTIVRVRGNFDEALKTLLSHREELGVYVLNSVNPYRVEGQKTVAFEIWEGLNRTPDFVVYPVGNAANISSGWKGFKELVEAGLADSKPRMIGVQAEGAAPIATAFLRGEEAIEPVEKPETVATAIRIGRPFSWKKAIKALRDSRGTAVTVSDEEILRAQLDLARMEGLFAEPAGAAPVAGLARLSKQGFFKGDETIVAVVTGHGLKDPSVNIEPYAELIIHPGENPAEALRKLL
ncbi:MAG: threonine synthase [Candidatus Brockarchaeota archaeon]|nr:threonine synthase [Candidatus Brockarchaeota archaeon]